MTFYGEQNTEHFTPTSAGLTMSEATLYLPSISPIPHYLHLNTASSAYD